MFSRAVGCVETYVSDYTVLRSDSGQTFTPVMSTARQGVVFAVQPMITPDRKSITLTVKPAWRRLLSLKKMPVPATQPAAGLTIEQPEILVTDIGTIFTSPSGQWRVLGWPTGNPSQATVAPSACARRALLEAFFGSSRSAVRPGARHRATERPHRCG